jgi:hypothetical protein
MGMETYPPVRKKKAFNRAFFVGPLQLGSLIFFFALGFRRQYF